jgi:hypothetical protein
MSIFKAQSSNEIQRPNCNARFKGQMNDKQPGSFRIGFHWIFDLLNSFGIWILAFGLHLLFGF